MNVNPLQLFICYRDDQMVFKERTQSSVPWSLKSAKQGTQKGIFSDFRAAGWSALGFRIKAIATD